VSELSVLTPKLHVRDFGTHKRYYFWCPACKGAHSVACDSPTRPNWSYNGLPDAPSFTPSVLINAPATDYRCHFFVTAGKIAYCNDCNHVMKGQTVDLPDIPPNYGYG
jgi:hypothetical protein